MSDTVDPKGITSGYVDHEDGWTVSMNANLRRLSAMGAEGFATDTEALHLLEYHYRGGMVPQGNGFVLVAGGSVDLTDASTNYVERTSDGTVSANLVGFTGGRIPMAIVTTLAGAITTVLDRRPANLAPDNSGEPQRSDVVIVTTGLTLDETWNGSADAGASFWPIKVVADHDGWLRLYETAADRTADAARSIDDDPTTKVALELIMTADTVYVLLLHWAIVNCDDPPTNLVYVAFTMLETNLGPFATVASDAGSGGVTANLSTHAPDNPLASGWSAWQYKAAAASWTVRDFGGILAIGGSAGIARTDVDFDHTTLRMVLTMFRESVDAAGTGAGAALFVPDTAIGSYNNDDYLDVAVARSGSTACGIVISDVALGGVATTLAAETGIVWAVSVGKTIYVERDGDNINVYRSDSDEAHRVLSCTAAIPTRFLSRDSARVGITGLSNSGGSAGFVLGVTIQEQPLAPADTTITLTRTRVEEVA